MTNETKDPVIETFKKYQNIGSGIFLYEPTSTNTPEDQDADQTAPSLIVLCTWMGGATDRRIQKYLDIKRDS